MAVISFQLTASSDLSDQERVRANSAKLTGSGGSAESTRTPETLSACGDSHALFVLASLRVMIPMRATCTTALLLASVCS